ncbi:MAG: hypothetical protein MZU95_10390 [Desulfomicrobium escambiense]|nr:hypothetical protein [Desulfomicrobium escambiense]
MLPHTARQFARAIVMPNLQAAGDHHRAGAAPTASASSPRCRPGVRFEPLMTLYLTDNTAPDEIARRARQRLRARA